MHSCLKCLTSPETWPHPGVLTTSVGHNICWSKLSRFKQEYFSLSNPVWHRLTECKHLLCDCTPQTGTTCIVKSLQSQSQRICPSQRGIRLKTHLSLMLVLSCSCKESNRIKEQTFSVPPQWQILIRLRLCTIALRHYWNATVPRKEKQEVNSKRR